MDGIGHASVMVNSKLRAVLTILVGLLILVSLIPLRAADTLPTRLSDDAYWKLINDLSEIPPGNYPYAVFTGNEPGYQEMLPQLTRIVAPGGTYLGVGPEQNYTYMAALKPKMGFLIDIRRDQMLQQPSWNAYTANIASLPTDSSSMFVRWTISGRPPWIDPISDFLRLGVRR